MTVLLCSGPNIDLQFYQTTCSANRAFSQCTMIFCSATESASVFQRAILPNFV